MALLVCCPCGNPLDCEHLEVVVTLTCPRCRRELTIEAEDKNHQSFHGVLTVMEGPYWVGEQFVLPIGEDLTLGKGAGNWLSLESDVLADQHCRLRFSPDGSVEIEDLSSESGTWIGPTSVVKGRLEPGQSFTIGEYRFKLTMLDALGGEAVVKPTAAMRQAPSLPALRRVGTKHSPTTWLVRNRFQIARWLIRSFAWLTAVYHFCVLRLRPGAPLEGYWAFLAALVILGALLLSSRRVTLAHRYLKYVSVAALVVLAVTDVVGARPASAIASLLLASTLPLFTTLVPSRVLAVFAGVLGLVSILIIAVLAINNVLALAAS